MGKPRKPVIILSGGNTTAPLVPHLVPHFDLAILDGANAEAQRQKYGECILPIVARIGEREQQAALNAAIRLTLEALALGGAPALAGRIEQLPEWTPFRGNGLAKDLDDWLPPYLMASLQRQIARNDALDALAHERRVVLCVTHEDVTEWFGGLAQWARAHGIPTLHVPHANSYLLPGHGPDVHETSICDYLAATPYMQDFYAARGYVGKIELTGSPLFDRWHKVERDREWARRCLRLDLERPVVVYASSWGQRTNARDDLTRFGQAVDAVLDAMREQPPPQPSPVGTSPTGERAWQLVFKLHPGETQGMEQAYADAAARAGVAAVVTRSYLELVLAAADVLVTLGPSNVLIDAALMDVPGICLRMPGYDIGHAAIPMIEPDAYQLVNAIEHMLSIQGQAEWTAQRGDLIYRNAYKADGQNAVRVAQMCKRIVNG